MSTNILIELASPNDFEHIASIYNEYILIGKSTMEEEIHTAQHIQNWVTKFNDRERLYVIKEDNIPFGWGIIKKYSDREGYRFACETAIYITQSKLRKGYGSLMKQHLISECKALDYRHLVAKIFAKNKGSILYNQRIGYTIVGTQKDIGFRNGKTVDIVIMQYLIQ